MPPGASISNDPSVNSRPEPWRHLADAQDGVISRDQLLGIGLPPAQARRGVDSGRWQRLLPGVYATFTGPVIGTTTVWAGVLYAGDGAAASHRTALWLAGVLDALPAQVDVSVPASRRVHRQPGVRVHLSRAMDRPAADLLHPAAAPPRIRVEPALLDQCELESKATTTHLVLSAVQRRTTTADRLLLALNRRPRHRWRSLVRQLLAEAQDGVASPLELAYRQKVERGHRLPVGLRNTKERAPGGGNWYRDVRYRRFGVVVELDGREAHLAHQAFRDLRRDNIAAAAGNTVLRYGWRDVVGRPCDVAAQVAHVLAARGWAGRTAPCSAACVLSTR